MHDLFQQALHFVTANQVLSGGFALMSFGGLVAWVVAFGRQIPKRIWGWIQRRLIISIDVANDDPLFTWLSLWLAEQPYSRKVRSLTATSERDEYGRASSQPVCVGESAFNPLPQILLTPAPGNHLLLYKGRLIWLTRDRKEAAPSGDSNSSFLSLWKREVFNIRMIGRSQEPARKLLEDARSVALSRRERKVEIFIAGYDYWQSIGERDPRPISSVFLPKGVTEGVVSDIEEFLDSQSWYVSRGIPWRRGFLFHGTPGSGKTSLISALAGYFKMNLYILSVSSAKISDDVLSSLLARVPMRSLLLLEDVDSAFEQRKKSKDVQNRLSFSGFLNAIDGAASKDGTIIFMTTNHREKLDAALIRPGRADVHVEFGYATAPQAEAMYRAFFPDAEGVDDFGGSVERSRMTMAEVQQHLLLNRDSAVKALNLPLKVERVA